MIQKIKQFPGRAYDLIIRRPLKIFKLLTHKEYYKAQTYYPNQKHKSITRVFLEQSKSVLLYGEPNEHYFLNGFDVKGYRRSEDYLPDRVFRIKRDNLNGSPKNHSLGILIDKLFFGIIAKSFGFHVPENIGIMENGEVFSLETKESISFESFLSKNVGVKFFLKLILGEEGGGKGVFSILFQDDKLFVDGKIENVDSFLKLLDKWRYIIQETVSQHDQMNKLYPYAINTTRIVTVNNNGEVRHFDSFLRIGANGSDVDNLSRGGLMVNILNEFGQLNSFGFYRPDFGTKVKFHPDTNIRFSDFTIPFYKEAVSQVMQFHKMLPQIYSIGWDVAITKDGPCIIEGNTEWGFSGHQTISGLNDRFHQFFI